MRFVGLLLLAVLGLTWSGRSYALHVILDPGHGGHDPGASYFGKNESDIVLAIAQKVESLLLTDSEFTVSLTRRSDRFLSLGERAAFSQNVNGDVLISLHANSSKKAHHKGAEFYIQEELYGLQASLKLARLENSFNHHEESAFDPSSEQKFVPPKRHDSPTVASILEDLHAQYRSTRSYFLASTLASHWNISRLRSPPVRQANFHLVTRVGTPAILVEVGFLSNPAESVLLSQEAYQHQIAQLIFLSLKKFKVFVDKEKLARLD